MKKKILSIILCITLFIVMGGCSGKNNDSSKDKGSDTKKNTNNENESVEMGRYVEHTLKLPDLKGEEKIDTIFYNKKGELEAYTNDHNKHKSKNIVFCYTSSEEGKWEKTEADWINSIPELSSMGYATDIQEGEDGLKYVLIIYSINKEMKFVIYKTTDEKTSEKVNLPHLEKKDNVVSDFKVLKDGRIVIEDGTSGVLKIYSGNDGTETAGVNYAINEPVSVNWGISGNKIITIDESGKNVIVYDAEKSQIERTIEYNFIKYSQVEFVMWDDGTIFAADAKGIHRVNSGGSLWETVADGSLCSLGSPNFRFENLSVVKGEPEEFYLESGGKIFQYLLDENISAYPETQITVYSLYENAAIRHGVSLYQMKNFDVKVNYSVAMEQEGVVETDFIRTLNTELFTGNGPDVLILDGLPVDSYIEKGVLDDIGNIVNPLVESKELFGNIAEVYKIQGKTYQMPTRFMVPIISGTEEVLERGGDLSDIVSYIENNPDLPFIKGMGSENLIKNMLAISNNELFENDEKLDEEKVISFLENLKIVSQNIDSVSVVEDSLIQKLSKNKMPVMELFSSNIYELAENKCVGAYSKISKMIQFFIPAALETEYKYSYSTVNNMFIPVGSVGLNSGSKEKEVATDFIRFLFSRDIQDIDEFSYEGLPVNEASLTKFIENTGLDDKIIMGDMLDDNGNPKFAESPSNEKRMEFLNIVKGLDNAFVLNGTIQKMISEPAYRYLLGNMTSKQVATEICSKVNTYLAE